MPSRPSRTRPSALNPLAAIDEWIGANNAARPRRAAKVRMDADLERARAAIAALITRELKQRAVLEALCATYIQNRHAIGQVTSDRFAEPYVACITLGGNRCSDTSTGRLWLRADTLARAEVSDDGAPSEPLISVRLSTTLQDAYESRRMSEPTDIACPDMPPGERIEVPLATARQILTDAAIHGDAIRGPRGIRPGTRRAYQSLTRQLRNTIRRVGAEP